MKSYFNDFGSSHLHSTPPLHSHYNLKQSQLPPRSPYMHTLDRDDDLDTNSVYTQNRESPVNIFEEIQQHLKTSIEEFTVLKSQQKLREKVQSLPGVTGRSINFGEKDSLVSMNQFKSTDSTISSGRGPQKQELNLQDLVSHSGDRGILRKQLELFLGQFQKLKSLLTQDLLTAMNLPHKTELVDRVRWQLQQSINCEQYIQNLLNQRDIIGLEQVLVSLQLQYDCYSNNSSSKAQLEEKLSKDKQNSLKQEEVPKEEDNKASIVSVATETIEIEDGTKEKVSKLLSYCKSLNTFDSTQRWDQLYYHTSTNELLDLVQQEIGAIHRTGQMKEQAKNEVIQKMLEDIKTLSRQSQEEIKKERAKITEDLQAQFDEQLRQEVCKLKEQQLATQMQSEQEIQEILLLNSDLENKQEHIKSLELELRHYQSMVGVEVSRCQEEYQQKIDQINRDKEQTIQQLQEDFSSKMESQRQEYEHLIQLKEAEIADLREKLIPIAQLKEEERNIIQQIKEEEEIKYEKRLQLVKKMHDEKIEELKRVGKERERELGDQIFEFNKQKDQLYAKAKEDAKKEEVKKREKFKAKIERIKQQELALLKRDQKETISELKEQIAIILQQLSKVGADRQQAQLLASVTSPDQSFYPVNKEPLDIQALKASIGEISEKIQGIENQGASLKQSSKSRSQNRLEKYKQSMFGSLRQGSNNQKVVSHSRLTSADKENNFKSETMLLPQLKQIKNSNQSFSFDQNRSVTRLTNKVKQKAEKITSKMEDSFATQAKHTINVQCDLGTTFFEQIDYRVCLRCGLNDKISSNSCNFHPAKCKNKNGVGNHMYSSEWTKCKESCKNGSRECLESNEHYYGSHLPYETSQKVNTKSKVIHSSYKGTQNKEVMTDVSLLFNPFKSGRTPLKERSFIRSTSRHKSKSVRRDRSAKHSTNKYHRENSNSPLTTSQLISDRTKSQATNDLDSLSDTQKSRLRVSSYSNQLDVYLQSQYAILKDMNKSRLNLGSKFNTETNPIRDSSQFDFKSKYLNTEEVETKSYSSASVQEMRSQNNWIKVEEQE